MRRKEEDAERYEAGVAALLLLSVAGAAYPAFVDRPEPVEVSNATELGDVRNDPDGDYVLVGDINLSQEGA